MKKVLFSLFLTAMALSGCTPKEVIDLPRGTATAEMEAAVDSFVEATKSRPAPPDSIQLHSIMIVKNGKVLLERWFNGEAADKPHVMHSVSKTFTATAIGLAISEGKLNLMDKVVSFFPDQLPADSSEYLNDMTIRDLLTMTCGHDEEPRVNKDTVNKVDWVTGFLAWPVKHKPGEYYLYNSVGTYMLSAILQKVTGEKLIDYLDKHGDLPVLRKVKSLQQLTKEDIALLKRLMESGKPVVAVVFAGRPLCLEPAVACADAILMAWHPGAEAGPAILDLLFGRVNPSAKLTASFPVTTGQCPTLYYDHIRTGRPAGKFKFTSKYLDAPVEPLFPFGFGLSYTTYQYSDISAVQTESGIHAEIWQPLRKSPSGPGKANGLLSIFPKPRWGITIRTCTS